MSLSSLPIANTVGWSATVVFVASYFFSKPAMLRGVQMLGSVLWFAFGVLIASKPVMASNLLVFAAAAWTLVRDRAVARAVSSPLLPAKEALDTSVSTELP